MAAKTLADELGPRDIRVNGLLPGRVGTERVAELDASTGDAEAAREKAIAGDPAGPLRAARGVRGGRGVPAQPGVIVRQRDDAARGRRHAAVALTAGSCRAPDRRWRSSSQTQVAEPEDRQRPEEPPLQPVEEVRAVAGVVGQLDRRRAPWPGPGSRRRGRGSRGRAGTAAPRAIRAEEIARVERSLTLVAPPVASRRTHPVTVTWPVGHRRQLGPGRPGVLGATSSRGRPAPPARRSVTSGVTTSTPAPPSRVWYFSTTVCSSSQVPWTVTRRHSSCSRRRPGRGRARRRRAPGAAFRLVATIAVVVLALVEPVELPLAQRPRPPRPGAPRRRRTAPSGGSAGIPRRHGSSWPQYLDWPGEHLTRLRTDLGTGRQLRPRRDRPARLADRPLQPALQLLHARRGPRLAAHRGDADRRRGRPAGHASASSSSASARSGSPAASRCCVAAWPASWRAPRRCDPTPRGLAHHQRARPLPYGARPWPPPGLDRVNVSLDTIRPRRLPRRSPGATASTTCSPGSPPPSAPASARSRSTRCCCAGSTTSYAPELLRWCLEHDYQLRIIEQMPLDAQHGWSREAMVTAEEIFALARGGVHAHPRPRAPRQRARRDVPRRRRTGQGRRDRLGHPPVLRRLRPGPADRRRPGPQLPVRPRGVRPARAPCAATPPTSEIADQWRLAMMTKRPGHGIDDETFLQPTRPMSAIGG